MSGTDRREGRRFALRLAVRCRRISLPSTSDGTINGESVKISSNSLLFTTTEAFLPGQAVEASIDWPARLNSKERLNLVVQGSVVGKVGGYTAMRIQKYKFRTRSAAEGQ